MKTIEWTGQTLLTRYGLMEEGRVIKLPELDADSYIAQKLAKEHKVKSTKTKEENS